MLGDGRKRPLAPWQVEEQAAADSRLLTLHLLLQALTGTSVAVERLDDAMVEGTLKSADDEMKCAPRLFSCTVARDAVRLRRRRPSSGAQSRARRRDGAALLRQGQHR